ncbi:MAG: winged helix-turn-helix domain-containing protein [Candidatus Thermoplasmatota archaeon]|nr:winged helix-turn-helix domain-containing protein [Candidatus Thermoplasmatota archaeon]
MRNLVGDIDYNAGKVWRALNEKGSLQKETILELTNLSEDEFYSAIGWLARENKIFLDNQNFFKLGETNLTPEIGSNAGKVWRVMKVWGEVDVSLIKRLALIDEKHVYSALGWLAREDKICFDENLMKYSLKNKG